MTGSVNGRSPPATSESSKSTGGSATAEPRWTAPVSPKGESGGERQTTSSTAGEGRLAGTSVPLNTHDGRVPCVRCVPCNVTIVPPTTGPDEGTMYCTVGFST